METLTVQICCNNSRAMSLSPTSGYCFFISKQKKTFCPRIFKKYFCFYKDQDDEYYQINKNKTRLFFIRNFFWLRYSLKLSSWFQEECLLSSWKKKNSWLQNVTILGTVSVQFRYECHGQRFILFPSSLCTFSHRLTNKSHKEGKQTLCRNADMDIRPHCLHNIL